MTYQKRLNPEIAGIAEDIANLNPGESLKLGPLANLSSVRWQVYSFLQTAGIKPYYIVRVKYPYLLVERKETDYKVEKVSRVTDIPEYLGELLKMAITQDNPQKFLVNKYKSGELSSAEFAEVLAAYYDTQK